MLSSLSRVRFWPLVAVLGSSSACSFSQDFDAACFGPGCKAQTAPRFVPQPGANPGEHSAVVTASEARSGKADSLAKPSQRGDVPASDEDDGSVAPPPDKPGYSH